MQKSAYEEYMKNVLGYNTVSTYNRSNEYYDVNDLNYELAEINLEDMYPEIYKTVYPMVQKAYNTNTRDLTEDLIEELTQDIYNNIKVDWIIENREEAKEDRQRRPNNFLRDLIKILLLRQFFGYASRPPYPPRPGHRPPMRPGFPPNQGGNRPQYLGGNFIL